MSFNLKNVLPQSAKPFVIRALILFIGWKLLYHLLLERIGIPDEQLTVAVQIGTIKLLTPFFDTVTPIDTSIIINGVRSVNIAPECNGLELIVLYVGFILCLPSSWKKMLAYIFIGSAVIYLLNLVRTALLAVMYYQSHSMTEFAHHYAFKIIIYAVVFVGWLLYVRKGKTNVTEG